MVHNGIIDKDFVRNRITQIRQSQNISARSLSLDLGYSSEATNQIETGRANPTLEYILALCNYFEITPSEFFDGGLKYPVQVQELIGKLGLLDGDELATIMNLVNHFTNKK